MDAGLLQTIAVIVAILVGVGTIVGFVSASLRRLESGMDKRFEAADKRFAAIEERLRVLEIEVARHGGILERLDASIEMQMGPRSLLLSAR